jgi:uncharacterized protein YcfJ
MNARAVVAMLTLAVPTAIWAQSQHFVAEVIRTVPIIEHQVITAQSCVTETVTPQSGSGGAVTGAIIGGVVGSQIAKGGDRTLGAGVGAIAGAVIGDNAARQPTTQQRCTPVTTTQTVTVGYDVTWRWRGQTMTQRMNRDPGSHVTVTVTAH